MVLWAQNSDILVEVDSSRWSPDTRSIVIADVEYAIQPLVSPSLRTDSAAEHRANWWILRPKARTDRKTWDLAHELVANNPTILYAEPDYTKIDMPTLESFQRGDCDENGYSSDWDYPSPRVFAWHLGDAHSQLKSVRGKDSSEAKIRIAHLDTGYDPQHVSLPKYLRTDLQRNFVEGENPYSAVDPAIGGVLNQPGHGTSTLALLAGNYVSRPQDAYYDYVGAAPFAEIVPVRISSTVILFQSSSLVQALYYIISANCDVLSMSMGGVPSKFWAEAVNDAYEHGIVLVTAAGNSVGCLPTTELVWPARFNRVIAVCGATYKGTPYFKYGMFDFKMQGNFGPQELMGSAIASYTPNVPWANRGCGTSFDYDGAGTSAATPQVAGAVALWLEKYRDYRYDHPWQRVNAVRKALFSTADKSYGESAKYYGNGILRAKRALDVAPFKDPNPIPQDSVRFPILGLLLGWRTENPTPEQSMLEVEVLRLRYNSPTLQKIFQEIEANQKITTTQRQEIKATILQMPECSDTLAKQLQALE